MIFNIIKLISKYSTLYLHFSLSKLTVSHRQLKECFQVQHANIKQLLFNESCQKNFHADHPHRGFQTVSYIKSGVFHHEDFKGHKGTIGPGDVQWMTAGRGIVHAEMPGSFEEDSIGFRLWLNLKSNQKMIEPRYQQFSRDKIPIFEKDRTKVKIICGKWEGHEGPIKYHTPSYFMDIQMGQNSFFELPINKSWNSIIFVYEGEVSYQGEKVNHQVSNLSCCVLEKSEENQVLHKFKSGKGKTGFILIGGQPLNEPIASHGPFVMNTNQQIQRAIIDYQTGKNGFQGSEKWESKIKNLSEGIKFKDL